MCSCARPSRGKRSLRAASSGLQRWKVPEPRQRSSKKNGKPGRAARSFGEVRLGSTQEAAGGSKKARKCASKRLGSDESAPVFVHCLRLQPRGHKKNLDPR